MIHDTNQNGKIFFLNSVELSDQKHTQYPYVRPLQIHKNKSYL